MLPGRTRVESGQVLNKMVHRYKCIRVEIHFPKQYSSIPRQTTNNFLSTATKSSQFEEREREREGEKKNVEHTSMYKRDRVLFSYHFPTYVLLINNVDPAQRGYRQTAVLVVLHSTTRFRYKLICTPNA